ncbi:hypothetical protein GCM10012288_09450 [Malaciobacter pacificus]|uniref:TonB-dependent receptor plug domain-containing protein n=1 Tax=Malaciobacter pacificus TaxID=1080223 RepID=UPI00102A52A4|nr:TonB-dependent receptor plug domain-containing protein [Malaciobacter pacificus]GGD37424.1 hypothetical protein GCM10012288_09450 [Malaciobacter pacificus]
MTILKKSLTVASLLFAVNSLQAVELEAINVTTTSLGQETNIDDVQASIEVFDDTFIKKTNAQTVPQLLDNALGVDVKNAGSTSSISLRGFNSSHTLLLIDGMRRTGKYGSFDLTSVQLSDIERIEIVRGPMSALYGADGIAGVINIITKKNSVKDSLKASLITGMAQNHERNSYIAKIYGNKKTDNISHNYGIEIRKKEDFRENKTEIATDLKNESRIFLSYGNSIKLNESNTLNTRLEYSKQNDDGKNYANVTTYEKENRYQLTTQYNYIGEEFIFDSNLAYGYSDTDVNRGSGSETTDYKQLELNNYFRHYTSDNSTNIIGAGYKNDKIDVSMYTKKA